MARIDHAGGAVSALLQTTMGTNSPSVIYLDVATGWPDGDVGPFYVVIDRGLATEEKVLIGSREGTTLNISTRGVDGSQSFAHNVGAKVEHCISATELAEANDHINKPSGVHGLTALDPVAGQAHVATAVSTHAGLTTGVHGVGASSVASNAQVATAVSNHAAETTGVHGVGTNRVAYFMPGEIKMWAGAVAPPLWLFGQGQAVSRTTYAALFAAIGTTYGVGDGSTTFNLPDFTDRVPMGGGVLGAAGGANSRTLATENLPSHNHSFSATTGSNGSHTHLINYSEATGSAYANLPRGTGTKVGDNRQAIESDGAHTHSVSGTTGSVGSGTAVDTTPAHQRVNFIIYAGV
jgi:microcystin-dependent protein